MHLKVPKGVLEKVSVTLKLVIVLARYTLIRPTHHQCLLHELLQQTRGLANRLEPMLRPS